MRTIYVGQIDPKTMKVYFKAQQVNSLADKFLTNCTEFTHCCMETSAGADTCADDYNIDISTGELTVKKCKDCGMYFFVSKDEASWYTDKGLKVPSRCEFCRKKRKNI